MAFNSTILPPHPYYPIDLEMAGYLANDSDTLTMVSKFAAACTVILSTTYYVATKAKPQISSSDLRRILWFTLSGSIHLFLEGYYAYNFRQMPSKRDLFGQLWKEYSLSDSRYQTQNSFVACMETITAVFWGPLSFLVAGMILRNHLLRYPFQIVVSLGQLYGDVLYYATFWFEFSVLGIEHGRPEVLYFWVYFLGLNGFWIVIPLVLIWKGIVACGKAFAVAEKTGRIEVGNGEVKKML